MRGWYVHFYQSDVPLKTDRPIHSSCTRHEPFLTRKEQPAHECCACCRVCGDRCDYPATSAHRLFCDGRPGSHRRLREALAPRWTADRSDRGSKRSFSSWHSRQCSSHEYHARRIRGRRGLVADRPLCNIDLCNVDLCNVDVCTVDVCTVVVCAVDLGTGDLGVLGSRRVPRSQSADHRRSQRPPAANRVGQLSRPNGPRLEKPAHPIVHSAPSPPAQTDGRHCPRPDTLEGCD